MIRQTGRTPDGLPLIGGVWTASHQDGMPIELSVIQIKSMGGCVDWFEAMLDASRDNNLPALMKQLEGFMDEASITNLKARFMQALAIKPMGEWMGIKLQ